MAFGMNKRSQKINSVDLAYELKANLSAALGKFFGDKKSYLSAAPSNFFSNKKSNLSAAQEQNPLLPRLEYWVIVLQKCHFSIDA